MSELLDRVVEANAAHAAQLDPDAVAKAPTRHLAVVTCMDARVDPASVFGIAPGEAHVIRNAGAIVTDDVERSLLLSQYTLGTRTVILAGHTDCGLLGHDEEATRQLVERERGRRPTWPLGSLADVEDGVRRGVRRLRQSPYLQHVDEVHGFVYDVATGRLREVDGDPA
jgi:carbonic anhydrase